MKRKKIALKLLNLLNEEEKKIGGKNSVKKKDVASDSSCVFKGTNLAMSSLQALWMSFGSF